MFLKVTYFILLIRFPHKTSSSSVCTLNTQALLNGKICSCNSKGEWICHPIERRQSCKPGKVIFQGCSRCICQESGLLACTVDSKCSNLSHYQSVYDTLTSVLPRCSPFKTYYINCNICICPASGKTIEARCAQDVSCTYFTEPTTSEISAKKNICIPNVMYLFPCLHCLCSNAGYFDLDKCVETCVTKQVEQSRRCIPKTLYRNSCNVCLCPESSIPNNQYCTNATCGGMPNFMVLRSLKNKIVNCTPHEFIKPRCIYCDCNHDGVVDEENCLELNCLELNSLKYDVLRESCSPGEMVPYCMECFCPRNGIVSDEYCSKGCSHQNKLKVLEKIMDMSKNKLIIDNDAIRHSSGTDICKPGSIYIDQGRYCLCPNTGISNFNLCTAKDKRILSTNNMTNTNNKVNESTPINLNMTCEPSTFVEFDCNTCFCSKKGSIDPKWCTYDDCESKRIVQESHIADSTGPEQVSEAPLATTCNTGSILSVDCNFCICPESKLVADKVCTKNDCSTYSKLAKSTAKFSCDPLAYYEVGCNICYCPQDGIKNVAMCTKNHCEKSTLRSDVCVPGQLFSDDCNVCVCPPNGNKEEKACTTHNCTNPWKKIFLLSESILGNQITEDATRNLDLCFPGEEFVAGCKLCVCPDMGLRMYAICSPTFCEDERHVAVAQELSGENRGDDQPKHDDMHPPRDEVHPKSDKPYPMLTRREEQCEDLDDPDHPPPKCTAGSMYIIQCQECICPYMGDIRHFCRPPHAKFYCEQAFPGINYMPMERRASGGDSTISNSSAINSNATSQSKTASRAVSANGTVSNSSKQVFVHMHTRFACSKRGRVRDDCFLCDCDGKSIIAEHCFQNNGTECLDASPTFLKGYVKSNRSYTKLPRK